VKLEESEDSNRHLQKLSRTNQVLLEKKTSGLADMEKELLQEKTEKEELSFELEKLRKQADFASAIDQDTRHSKSPKRERTPMGYLEGDSSPDGDTSLEDEQEVELARLRKAVRDLSVKLQSSVSHKKQLEREMEELVSDNTGLSHTLEGMEGDMRTLQLRLDEASERSTDLMETSVEPTPPSTPKSSAATIAGSSKTAATRNSASLSGQDCSTLTLDAIALAATSSSTSSSSSSSSSVCGPSTAALSRKPVNTTTAGSDSATTTSSTAAAVVTGGANEQSLFSEFGDEYSSLQHKYQELLASCVCSHRGKQPGSSKSGEEDATSTLQVTSPAGAGPSSSSTSAKNQQGAFTELSS